MTELSLSAKAVLTAVTQQFYCLDPEDVPYCVSEYRSVISTALRAAADQVVPVENMEEKTFAWQKERLAQRLMTRDKLLAIATELEAQ